MTSTPNGRETAPSVGPQRGARWVQRWSGPPPTVPPRTGDGNPPVAAIGPLAALIRAANISRARATRTVLHRHRLTWTSFDLLHLVCRTGSIETRAAAAELGVAKATLSGALDILTGRGLVQRWRNPADRRLVLVYPTAGGVALTRAVHDELRALETVVLATAGIPDGPELTATLRAIARAARRPL